MKKKVHPKRKEQILLDNAAESWLEAIKYADLIANDGLATLGNKKHFIASLQNAIELFLKQVMINNRDYRVVSSKIIDVNGDGMRSLLEAVDLNLYFGSLNSEEVWFKTIQMSELIGFAKKRNDYFLKKFFKEVNSVSKTKFLEILQELNELRNEETHFFINSTTFLTDNQFAKLYNFMIEFTDFFRYYRLLDFGFSGELMSESEQNWLLFKRSRLDLLAFSYKKQFLKNKKFVILKECLTGNVIPDVDDCYSLATEFYNFIQAENFCFEEIYTYTFLIKEFELLNYQVETDIFLEEDGEKREFNYYVMNFNES